MKSIWNNFLSYTRIAWKWYASQYRGLWYQKLVTPIATFFAFFFLYLGAVDINFLYLFGVSPSSATIEHPIRNEASLIYSSDSVLIGKLFNENRSPVHFDEISPYVVDALISTEDERFYLHHGIDYEGLFAAFKDIATGKPRGASTITQQLVKNLFKVRSQYSTGILGKIPGLSIAIQKSKEWITAIKIENLYNKEDILTLYLNTVDFGSNAYGIKTAAKTYFKTTPKNLTAEQAAVLIGSLKATTTYNPLVNPDNSLSRRNVVLNNMYEHGKLTLNERDSLQAIPLILKHTEEKAANNEGLYFKEALRSYLSDWCEQNDIDLMSDGLTIYTTLDTRLQHHAEAAVVYQMAQVQRNFDAHWGNKNPWCDEHGVEIPGFIENLAKQSDVYKALDTKYKGNADSIDYYMNLPRQVKLFTYSDKSLYTEREMSPMDSIRYMTKFMHCGFVVMEPQTSYVRAWVGDVNFDAWKYDKVTAMRQPGSTFKLFVYAAAMEHLGLNPMSLYRDRFISMQVPDDEDSTKLVTWMPHNADGRITNVEMPLKSAFAQSINTIAVQLGQDVGIDKVVEMAKAMGVKSPLKPTPSLALGSSDMTLLELVDAYCSVVNDGVQRDPILVTKILDREGNVIYDCDVDIPQAHQAMSYKTAFYMQRLLYSGVYEGGTSSSLRRFVQSSDTQFGGKTGTSSNHSDAWFVGVTPNLVGAAWVGGEYRCIHFRTGRLGQGSKTALPIFGYFLDKVLKDPNFRQYHGMWSEPKETISSDTYNGAAYIPQHDTTRVATVSDSLNNIGNLPTKKEETEEPNNIDADF